MINVIIFPYFRTKSIQSCVVPSLCVHERLISGDAVRRVVHAEDVELVERGEGDEEDVPEHQHGAVLAVQLPAVAVSGHHQEHHRREQRQRRVDQT